MGVKNVLLFFKIFYLSAILFSRGSLKFKMRVCLCQDPSRQELFKFLFKSRQGWFILLMGLSQLTSSYGGGGDPTKKCCCYVFSAQEQEFIEDPHKL